MPIEIRSLQAGYGEAPVLDRVSLTLPDQGVVAFTGPSGSGKTTLLRVLAGLLLPQAGSVKGLAGKRISMVFQEDRLLPWCTVRQNVVLAGDEKTARSCLAQVELEEDMDRYPGALSGGMQRRVAIARALCFRGDVLMLDEPFKGLDDALKTRLIPHIRQSAPLIFLVTHDIEDVEAFDALRIPFPLH